MASPWFVKSFFDHKGFSIDQDIPEFGKTLGEELLTPRLYPKAVLPLIGKTISKVWFISQVVVSMKTFHAYYQMA